MDQILDFLHDSVGAEEEFAGGVVVDEGVGFDKLVQFLGLFVGPCSEEVFELLVGDDSGLGV